MTVHGAGRTDAGVHALGQVASVTLTSDIAEPTLARALNAVLPVDVRVLAVEAMDETFHARFSARAKTYEYRIVNAPLVSPFLQRYVWHVPQPLDIEAMRAAAGPLVGAHDFAGVPGRRLERGHDRADHPRPRRRGRRRVRPAARHSGQRRRLPPPHGPDHRRHAGRDRHGRWDPWTLLAVLESRDRAQAGPTAPANGLFLAPWRTEPLSFIIQSSIGRRPQPAAGRCPAGLLGSCIIEVCAWRSKTSSPSCPPGPPKRVWRGRWTSSRLPAHIAVIMDGNGRWAAQRHLPRVEGHRAGIESVREVVEGSARLGIRVLTLYAFSVENWKRPASEVSTLMMLLKRYLRSS